MSFVGQGWFWLVASWLAIGSVGRAEDNVSRTSDATWARIVLGEELFPNAGVLTMAGAFADGSLGRLLEQGTVVDVPLPTLPGQPRPGLAAIRKKYGPPTATTNAAGTMAQSLQRQPRRGVIYHGFGAVALISEADGETLVGLGLGRDVVQQLAGTPDLKLVAERWIHGTAQSALETTCPGILRQIDQAKRRWAKDTGRAEGATPFALHIAEHIPGAVIPKCPEGGEYRFNVVGQKPECTRHHE